MVKGNSWITSLRLQLYHPSKGEIVRKPALDAHGTTCVHRLNAPYDPVVRECGVRVKRDGSTGFPSEDEETGATFTEKVMGRAPKTLGNAMVIIHSWNPAGAMRMYETLAGNGWIPETRAFDLKLLKALQVYCKPMNHPSVEGEG